MELEVSILPDARTFSDAFARDLSGASGLAVAVAFAKESVLSAVDIETWCKGGRRLRLLAGTDYALTELDLLHRLQRTGAAECRVFHSVGGRMFHPKLYIMDKGPTRVAYVGSSNFTRGGFFANIEANARLAGPSDAPEIGEASRLFESLFSGEFATPVTPQFEADYRELQEAFRVAQRYRGLDEALSRLRVSENLVLSAYRARTALGRWLLVVSPENFDICMRTGLWGRQQQAEAEAYRPGDLFVFHVTSGRGIGALGMFTGPPFYDPTPLWPGNSRGVFPWRIRFVILAEVRTGIPTRVVLEPLRIRPPKNWFHGFIQQSHALSDTDFAALMGALQEQLRRERLAD
jgi:HKD family nuclease